MFPQAFSRQLVSADCFVTAAPSAKIVAIQHVERLHLPAAPICDLGPEPDRYTGHSEIQIREVDELFAIAGAPLNYDETSAPHVLGHRIDL